MWSKLPIASVVSPVNTASGPRRDWLRLGMTAWRHPIATDLSLTSRPNGGQSLVNCRVAADWTRHAKCALSCSIFCAVVLSNAPLKDWPTSSRHKLSAKLALSCWMLCSSCSSSSVHRLITIFWGVQLKVRRIRIRRWRRRRRGGGGEDGRRSSRKRKTICVSSSR